MPKWFDEKMLHLYWIKNCKKYNIPNGPKIIGAKLNPIFDRYPDILENQLENGDVVPCEIEWTTKDFDHDINVLLNSNGFLVTFIENASFAVPQIKINEDDFIDWFSKNAKKIAEDTIGNIRKSAKSRTQSFIWLLYVGKRGNIDVEIALKTGIWGFPKSKSGKRRGLDRISDIKIDDVVIIVRNFTYDETFKKPTPRTKDKKSLIGKFGEIIAVRVTHDYYETKKNEPWINGIYPHRFNFDNKRFLFRGKDVPCNFKDLGEYLHNQMVSQLSATSLEHINSSYYLKLQNLCAKYEYL